MVAPRFGRITRPAREVLAQARPVLGLGLSAAPFDAVVSRAASLSWARDPFDRIIAGSAMADDCDLLTADETMRHHLAIARWPD